MNSEFNTAMTKTFSPLLPIALLATAPVQAQSFSMHDVVFWVGAGPDSTVLVVDFHDGADHSSYAWGYLHDGTATGADLLAAVAAADPLFTVDISGGFLSDLSYNGHMGIGGAPNWWSTWTGTGIADMYMNMGISEPLSNGSWFGCSYEAFDPNGEPTGPTEPIAAQLPTSVGEHGADVVQNVFPQPAIDVITIQVGSAYDLPVRIWNLAGGVVFTGRTSGTTTTLHVEDLAPGLYVLQVGGAQRTIAVQ